MKSLASQLRARIQALFVRDSYQKRGRAGRFVRDVNSEVYGGVYLGTHPSRNTLDLDVFICVGHHRLEQLVGELSENVLKKYEYVSYQAELGHLTPYGRWLTWVLTESDEVPEVADEIWDLFQLYGLPFIERNSTLEQIYASVREENLCGATSDYRGPVALYLLGREKEARALIDAQLNELEGDYPAAQDYQMFASRFLGLMDTDSPSAC